MKKTEEKFPSSSLGKNFPFGWCFLENSWTDWQLAKTRVKGKVKKKKQKSLKRLISTFGHAWSIGERKAISAKIHLERLSTVSRPSVDWLLSKSRPTFDCYIDGVLTDYRSLYWPIDRSTLPTVNMIRFSLQLKFFSEKPFYGNYSMLDSHTKTVISHLFAYSSRWHWKLRGLLLQNTTVSDQNSWDTSTQSCF